VRESVRLDVGVEVRQHCFERQSSSGGRAVQCLPTFARMTGSKRRHTHVPRRGRSMVATVRGLPRHADAIPKAGVRRPDTGRMLRHVHDHAGRATVVIALTERGCSWPSQRFIAVATRARSRDVVLTADEVEVRGLTGRAVQLRGETADDKELHSVALERGQQLARARLRRVDLAVHRARRSSSRPSFAQARGSAPTAARA